MPNQVDVVIVGAGLSGLAAAWEIKKSGKSFIILEAQDRVGGRVYSISHQGSAIDLGAQWISSKQKRMQSLLKQFNIKSVPTYKDGKTIYDIHGSRMTNSGSKQFPPLSPIAEQDLMRTQQTIDHLINQLTRDTLFTSPFAKKYDSVTVDAWFKETMISDDGKAFYRMIAEDASSVELHEISFLDLLWCAKSCGGFAKLYTSEDEWIPDGAHTLPLRMGEEMKERIRLNEPVRNIVWETERAQVYTEDGCWEGRRAIVAMPPAFAGRIQYDPPLPAARDQLCQRVGQGSVIKSIIVYEKPFWREMGYSGVSFYDQGPVKITLDSSTPGQPLGMLTALVGGQHARRLGSLDSERRKNEIIQCVQRMFGSQSLQYLAYYEKDWSMDPWARGGYAGHFAPGVLTQFGEALIQPVGPIHWAGTETSFEWHLYMEGALESGERAAREVLEKLY